jgi:hypothetical protein
MSMRAAISFRNAENCKTAIYFHCGGLDLYPLESRERPKTRRTLAFSTGSETSSRVATDRTFVAAEVDD